MNAPAHPAWCRTEHTPEQRVQGVHTAPVGEVMAGAASVLVELNDVGDGPHVTLGVTTADTYAAAELQGAGARSVATLLGRAADLLAGPVSGGHAFRLADPYPAGHLWTCLCGARFLQRHDEQDINRRLLAHLGGDPQAQLCPSGCGLALGDCLTCPEVTR